MPGTYSTVALLALAMGSCAVDMRLYEENAYCRGPYLECPNQPRGKCCFGSDLYESCAGVNPNSGAIAYSRQNGEVCGVQIGSDSICYSGGSVAVISGCTWGAPVSKRDENTNTCNGTVNASVLGQVIDDKEYRISTGGAAYQTYRSIANAEEREVFLMGHAETVKDV